MPAGKNLTKDEVIAMIRDLAAKLERRPSMAEICVALHTSIRQVRKVFATYAQAVEAAGLDPTQGGHLTVEELFQDWIGVTRKVGRIPTVYDYEKESRYSLRPLQWRFGSWKLVPGAMLQFGDQRQCWAGWEDVRGIVQAHVDAQKAAREAKLTSTGAEADANLTYGEPLTSGPLAVAPTQEMGVMLLFGWLARHLGFVVLKTQNIFPDCEALRRLEDKKWMRVWIEFEFESRNFLVHGHDAGGCDLIVCWEHNWADCPLEVIELRKIVGLAADLRR